MKHASKDDSSTSPRNRREPRDVKISDILPRPHSRFNKCLSYQSQLESPPLQKQYFCRSWLIRTLTLVLAILAVSSDFPSALAGTENQLSTQSRGVSRGFITDHRGKKFSTTEKPTRIVSASLASDEIIFDLLEEAGETHRLVAVSTLADNGKYSNIAHKISMISGRVGSDVERTISLKPDLVILASFNRPELILQLESAGLRVFVMGKFTSLNDIATNITTLGTLIAAKVPAKKLRKSFLIKSNLRGDFPHSLGAATTSKKTTDRPSPLRDVVSSEPSRRKNHSKVPTVLNWSPGGMVMAGRTIFDSIVTASGSINLATEIGLVGWPVLSAERVLSLNPSYIVISGRATDRNQYIKTLQKTPGWAKLAAVKKKQLIIIPQRWLSATSHYASNAVVSLRNALVDPD